MIFSREVDVEVEFLEHVQLEPSERFYIQTDYRTPGKYRDFLVLEIQAVNEVLPLRDPFSEPVNHRKISVYARPGTNRGAAACWLKIVQMSTTSRATVRNFVDAHFGEIPVYRTVNLYSRDYEPWSVE